MSRRERERRRRAARWREVRRNGGTSGRGGSAEDELEDEEDFDDMHKWKGSPPAAATKVATRKGTRSTRVKLATAIVEAVQDQGDLDTPQSSLPTASSPLSNVSVPRSVTTGYEDQLLTSLAGFWDCFNITSPIVHQKAFEEAFVAPGSTIYGANPPTALLYAMAANGTRFAELPSSMDGERLRCSRYFVEKAKDLLLSGYYGSGQPVVTDIEALQTLFLIYNYLIPERVAPGAFVLMERGVDILIKLYTQPDGTPIGFRPPVDAIDWLHTELVLRMYILYAIWDVAYAYLVGRDTLHPYFSHPVALPSHESYFVMPPPEAFVMLRSYLPQSSQVWTIVDFSLLTGAFAPDPATACQLVDSVIAPIFQHRASHLAAVYCLGFLREFRRGLRQFAQTQSIDPVELASQHAPNDSPAETVYRQQVATFDAMGSQIALSLPQEIGLHLAAGDPRPLLHRSNFFFPDYRYAHSFLCSYISARCMAVENWMPNIAEDPPVAFYSSPDFLSTLESGILVVRLMSFQMAEEERLRWSRPWAMVPVLRVGGLHVAAVKMCRGAQMDGLNQNLDGVEAAKEDVRVIWRWLDVMGAIHRPLGRMLALNFRKVMRDAGIEPESPAMTSPPALSVVGQAEGGDQDPTVVADSEVPASFSGTVLAAETWCRPWLR